MAEYQYRERNVDSVEKRATQRGGSFESIFDPNIETFKPKTGINVIRILPPTWAELDQFGDHYGVDVYIHSNIGPEKGSFICPSKMGGLPCPICEMRAKMEKTATQEELSSLVARKRVVIWVIDRDKPEEGPKIWGMPWTLDREIASLSVDKRRGAVLHIDHPNKGYDVEFTKEGEKKRTEYIGIRIDREPTPISDSPGRFKEWMDFIQKMPVPDTLILQDYDYIKAAFGGKINTTTDDGVDKDETEKPKADERVGRTSLRDRTEEAPAAPPPPPPPPPPPAAAAPSQTPAPEATSAPAAAPTSAPDADSARSAVRGRLSSLTNRKA